MSAIDGIAAYLRKRSVELAAEAQALEGKRNVSANRLWELSEAYWLVAENVKRESKKAAPSPVSARAKETT